MVNDMEIPAEMSATGKVPLPQKVISSVKHNLPLVNPSWLFSIPCFVYLVIPPRRIPLVTFPGTEVSLMDL